MPIPGIGAFKIEQPCDASFGKRVLWPPLNPRSPPPPHAPLSSNIKSSKCSSTFFRLGITWLIVAFSARRISGKSGGRGKHLERAAGRKPFEAALMTRASGGRLFNPPLMPFLLEEGAPGPPAIFVLEGFCKEASLRFLPFARVQRFPLGLN